MHTKQTIAIIGASGKMGTAMAKSLAKGNYRLLLRDSKPHALGALVDDIQAATPAADVEATICSADACWEADIIILAVPYTTEQELAEKIREVANQKIVISLSNPTDTSATALVTAPGTSAGEELQKLLPNSKVVKAFNTTSPAAFASPVINGQQVDALIAGNDKEALSIVAELVTTLGFNSLIVGGLAESRTLEAMQLLLMRMERQYNHKHLAGWTILHT
jgi:NADPH-dependent F420 reductase